MSRRLTETDGSAAGFEEAANLFTALRDSDPYRIEDLDVFSNILYVSEKRAELAALAQEYVKVERMRPEVCCLIGELRLSWFVRSVLLP